MTKLRGLIGTECALDDAGDALAELVAGLAPTVVGAHLVACSDETERECAEAFQRRFAGRMLPELKPSCRATFCTANLGARYEWGSVRIAEEHYAVSAAPPGLKVVVVKINSHVAVRQTSDGPEYGWLTRYGGQSACCGALAAMMEGSPLPAALELVQTFSLDGRNRLGTLGDPRRVPVEQRALLAAAVNARLQARRAALDIGEHRPHTPAIFLVVPGVTINRPGPDTELIVGQYGIDWTGQSPAAKYQGLGDDPAAYRVRHEQGRVVLADGQWPGNS
jgi:hypothetical protein